jgi:hypothetical protein
MKIDQIALQGIGKPLASVHGLSSGFGGAGVSWLVGDESPGAAGAGNSLVTLGFDTDPSKPITFSFLPQSGISGGSDGSFNSFATPTPVTLIEDYGAASPKSGPPSVEFFAGPGSGGGHGGGGGGTVPPPYTPSATNNIAFVINWDSSVGSAPSGFVTGVEAAVDYFRDLQNLSGPAMPTSITLNVGWGETGGTRLSTFALGQSLTYIEERSYSEFQPHMASMASVPSADPLNAAAHQYWMPTAEEKALGLGVLDKTLTSDGAVGFGSRFSWDFSGKVPLGSNQYDFVAVAKHEISEAMGRIAVLGGTVGGVPNSYTPFDLFRFTDTNVRSLTGGADAYFSYDGGKSSTGTGLTTDPRTYFNSTAGGDWGDWQSSGTHTAGNDAYDAFASPGSYSSSPVDLVVMRALGYGTV